jgi:hypothetical protein
MAVMAPPISWWYNSYPLLFKPGTYNVNIPIGFYTSIHGLGVCSIFLTNNITCARSIACPIINGVNFPNMINVHLDYGSPSIGHIINNSGAPAGGTNNDGTINSWIAVWGAYPQNR